MKIVKIERIKDHYQAKRPPPWLISFTDLITLLLAFFILLFATTKVRNEAWVQASTSMRTSFAGKQKITEVTGESGQESADKAWLSRQTDPGLDLSYLISLVRKRFAQDAVLDTLEVWHQGDSVLVSLPASTTFQPGKDVLSPEGVTVVARLAPFLAQLSNNVEIVGHADPSLIDDQGRFGSNWHLSLARAQAVADALVVNGYDAPMAVRGRGTTDMEALPKNLPEDMRNERARRVDIRLHVVQP
jgi:chemotaxis protein MotB